MRNLRCYYHATIEEFMRQSAAEIAGVIHSNDISADTRIQQSNTWEQEIAILKDQLRPLNGGELIFEYSIPRMGKAWSSSSPRQRYGYHAPERVL